MRDSVLALLMDERDRAAGAIRHQGCDRTKVTIVPFVALEWMDSFIVEIN